MFIDKYYKLDITTHGSGSISAEPLSQLYEYGTIVILTATPETGYEFSGWSGDTATLNDSLVLTMIRTRSITAGFSKIGTYRINTAAEHGSVTADPEKEFYEFDEIITVSATADEGYMFDHWSGSLEGSQNPAQIIIDGHQEITAHFALKQFTLSLSADQGASLVTNTSLTASWQVPVPIEAALETGYHFTGWAVISGNVLIEHPESLKTTVTLSDGNASIKATTTLKEYTITILEKPDSGTIILNPLKTSYLHGQTVTISAQPATGFNFDAWGCDIIRPAGSFVQTVMSDMTICAAFKKKTYFLTTSAINGSITKSPDKLQYEHGETVELTANPATGYRFVGWSGDAIGTASPKIITMTSDKSIIASFTLKTYTLTKIAPTNGTITIDPIKTVYAHGEPVTITANAGANYHFSGWGGSFSGIANPLVIQVTADSSVSATFDPDAPSNLSYTETVARYVSNITISDNIAQWDGGPVTFTSSPALPTGLSLNTSTGRISGSPTTTFDPTIFTIAATNSSGSTSKQLTLSSNFIVIYSPKDGDYYQAGDDLHIRWEADPTAGTGMDISISFDDGESDCRLQPSAMITRDDPNWGNFTYHIPDVGHQCVGTSTAFFNWPRTNCYVLLRDVLCSECNAFSDGTFTIDVK